MVIYVYNTEFKVYFLYIEVSHGKNKIVSCSYYTLENKF